MSRAADGFPDDRVVCTTCLHCDAGSYRCTVKRTSVVLELPLRCLLYRPDKAQADQRPGSERWAGLKELIAEVRELDRKHAEARS